MVIDCVLICVLLTVVSLGMVIDCVSSVLKLETMVWLVTVTSAFLFPSSLMDQGKKL